jgi:hypothetical protein
VSLKKDASEQEVGRRGLRPHGKHRARRRLVVISYRFLKQGKRYLPPVLRGFLGLIFIFAGILGFLPVLGFWMIPLGIALLATDIPVLRRWLIKRLNHHRRDQH